MLDQSCLPRPTAASFLIAALLLTKPAVADDWPGYRGASLDGAARNVGDLFEGEGPGLEIAWRAEVGSAYSSIAVKDGTVITLGSDGTNDLAIAVDGQRGVERWRRIIGPVTAGHDGSENGPLSTPAISGNRVFVLGADGTLVALSLDNGDELWRVAPDGGELPFYSHSTSPLVFGDLVIVSRGTSDDGVLRAHRVADGALAWTAASGTAEYQSPVAMTLDGTPQILFWLNEKVVALDESGEEIWSATAPANTQQSPVQVDSNSLLLPGSRSSSLHAVTRTDDGWTFNERWSSRRLKPSMSSPVVHDGQIYGFDRNFLTAIDVETGDVTWKSRPPGGTGLVLVGDRLAIYAQDGVVVLAKATTAGFQEEARIQATRRESLAWPAFADGTLFVRDATHLAAIRITDEPMRMTEADVPVPDDTAFGRWWAQAKSAEDPTLWVEHLMRTTDSFPIREGNRLHFVYRGPAENVGLTGSWLSQREEVDLERLGDSDLHARTVEMDPALRLEYGYRIDFDTVETDPLNPRVTPGRFGGIQSELPAAGVEAPPYFAPYSGDSKGRIETFTLNSQARGDEREISVYLPAKAADAPALLLVPRGGTWRRMGQLPNMLDHLIADGTLPPLVVAFVPPARRMPFTEDDGADTPAMARLLAEELVLELAQRFEMSFTAERTFVLVNGWQTALGQYTALAHPEVVGGAVILSRSTPSQWTPTMVEMMEHAEAKDLRFFVSWNQIEPDFQGISPMEQTAAIAERLRAAGIEVLGGEQVNTAGWGAWRVAAIEGLRALLGD